MKKWGIVGLIIFGVILAWSFRYRYDHISFKGQRFPIRTHRLTDRTEMLDRKEWKVLGPGKFLSRSDLGGLHGTGKCIGNNMYCDIYNGSEWTLTEITILLKGTVIRPVGREQISRRYHLQGKANPFTSGEFTCDLGLHIAQKLDWSWRIISARGHKTTLNPLETIANKIPPPPLEREVFPDEETRARLRQLAPEEIPPPPPGFELITEQGEDDD